jgi:hypothetical protein
MSLVGSVVLRANVTSNCGKPHRAHTHVACGTSRGDSENEAVRKRFEPSVQWLGSTPVPLPASGSDAEDDHGRCRMQPREKKFG